MTTDNPTSATPAPQGLLRKLERRQFAITMELTPPRTPDLATVYDKLERNYRGVADAVNFTDCPSAVLRMSSLGGCLACLRAGLEPVLQLTCRDRNRLALQSELLTAYALGVRNVLCLTGDHVRFGDHPSAKPAYDLDAVGLIAAVAQLRDEGRACSGVALSATPKGEPVRMDWLIGAAANPYGNEPETLALHLDKKCRAGADFIQTQPIYDVEGFARWWRALEALELPARLRIMPGILPVKSARSLELMRQRVSGIWIPDAAIERMRGAADPEAEGRKMALEIAAALLQYPIAGVHLYPVFWESVMPELAAAIRGMAPAVEG